MKKYLNIHKKIFEYKNKQNKTKTNKKLSAARAEA